MRTSVFTSSIRILIMSLVTYSVVGLIPVWNAGAATDKAARAEASLRTQSKKPSKRIRVGIVQSSVRAGDFRYNLEEFLKRAKELDDQGVDYILSPEAFLPGYPSNDLLEDRDYVERSEQTFAILKEASKYLKAKLVVGHIRKNNAKRGKQLENAAIVLHKGEEKYAQAKVLLPTGGWTDDARHLRPGKTRDIQIVEIDGVRIGILICEDSWWRVAKRWDGKPLYEANPVLRMKKLKPDYVFVITASAYHAGKQEYKDEYVFGDLARYLEAPVVAVNQVGVIDQMIFNGASGVYDIRGKVVFKMPSFKPDAAIISLPTNPDEPTLYQDDPARPQSVSANTIDEVEEAVTFGIREFVHQIGHDSVVFGLSGGSDSTMVAYAAAKALGPENVYVIMMPNDGISTPDTITDSEKLIMNLGIPKRNVLTLPITELVTAFRLTLVKAGFDDEFLEQIKMGNVAFENFQARSRMLLEFFISNLQGDPTKLEANLTAAQRQEAVRKLENLSEDWKIFFSKKRAKLATSDKSELAISNSTYLGDLAGVYGPIADLYKSFLFKWGRRINERAGREIIPVSVLTKAPTPGLKRDQLTTDRFPPYEDVLDPILIDLIENGLTPQELRAKYAYLENHPAVQPQHKDPTLVDFVLKQYARGEWKREMMQFPVARVSRLAFGKERRVLTTGKKYEPVPNAQEICTLIFKNLGQPVMEARQ